MTSKYICLLRHADYEQRQSAPSAYQPFPLTSLGEKQAAETVDLLKNFIQSHHLQIHSNIYSSSLLRAWQTADIIKKHLRAANISIEMTMQLAERCVGSVANMTVSEIEKMIELDPRYQKPPENWKSDSQYCLPFPGAESMVQAGKRVATYLNMIISNVPEGKLAIVVGHGASIRHAAYQLGILEFSDIKKLSMYHCKPVFFKAPSSDAAKWSHVDGQWKVRKQTEQPD